MEQLKKAVPQMVFHQVAQNVTDNIIMNTKKPPFDNPKVRQAVSYAIDRRGLIQASHQGGAVLGSAMLPRPFGVWGMPEKDLLALPGYGKADEMKARAKKLLAEAGITPDKPLKVEMATRAIAIYVDMASFVINELKQVGIEATLKQVETAQWHPMATRGEYQIGANLTGVGTDDPDANFFENYACGSPRNYSQYCSEQVMKAVRPQSQELDPKKRLEMVIAIQKKLEQDAARPVLAQRLDYFAHWPHVKNLVPAQQRVQLRPDSRTCGATSDTRALTIVGGGAAAASGGRSEGYIAQRLAIGVVTLLGMSVVIFLLLRLAPGNIVDILFSTGGYVNPSERAAIERELGLDKPIWIQYVDWLGQLAVGNLGKSYRYDVPAWEIIKPLIPVTIELAMLSLVISVLLGVPTGVVSAVRQDTRLDYALRVFSLAGLSMPSFWLGMVIILGLVAWLGWIPPVTYVRSQREPAAPRRAVPAARAGRRLSLVRAHHAHHALVAARGAARGLRAHGVGEGPEPPRGDLAPRAEERHPARGHRHRHRVRVPDRRAGGDGDGVQPARPRPLPRPGDPVARLSDRAEPRDVHRGRRHPLEPHRRHALRRARSARPLWPVDRSAPPTSPGCPRGRPGPGCWTVLARFCRKKPLGAAGGAIMLLIVLTAVFADQLQTHDPIATDAAQSLAPPGREHWLGSDHLGPRRLLAHRARRPRLPRRRASPRRCSARSWAGSSARSRATSAARPTSSPSA